MSAADKSKSALECIHRGEFARAAQLLASAVAEKPTASRWNDLGFTQVACKLDQESENSFRQALALAPDHVEAAINLGALLASTGRRDRAVHWLELGLRGADEQERAAIEELLAGCRADSGNAGATKTVGAMTSRGR